MKTSPLCLECFKRQIDYCAKLATPATSTQQTIVKQVEALLDNLDYFLSPPENAMQVYSTISNLSNNQDPFADIKQQSTHYALSIRDKAAATIDNSENPLYIAAKFALAGNIIDYGSQQDIDLDNALKTIFKKEPVINHFDELRSDLSNCKSLLYLADNCGEIVFDGLFIDQIASPTTIAVKDAPIINDATASDALQSRLNPDCRIISNGTTCPGTPIDQCSEEFKDLFYNADVIISKGQGNFETLSEIDRTVYFMLTVKCGVVADHLKKIANWHEEIPIGDCVILKKK